MTESANRATQKSKWVCNVGPFSTNHVLRRKTFYVSYNPHPGSVFTLYQGDDGSDETALVNDGKFYILNGDFRTEYEQLAPKGFKACKAFYDKQRGKYRSSWSTGDRDELKEAA